MIIRSDSQMYLGVQWDFSPPPAEYLYCSYYKPQGGGFKFRTYQCLIAIDLCICNKFYYGFVGWYEVKKLGQVMTEVNV